ncbi:MAG: hypothetical protein COZ85_03205 [Candidatus Moranbacteria bacterium CG_4_8_14_3_um_filter_34_16]|nr:MAG: hypothetical protein COZ85_03205 [Candidatus Moranbacteria bacterium CG_4_8_14_3_um_filter_34_16]
MKKVLFTLYKKHSHSLYKQFIDNSPAGYEYFTLDDFFDEFIFEKSSNLFSEITAKIKRNQKIVEVAGRNKIDIIYCCDGMLLFNSPIPWILEFEHATSLIAHNFGLWKIVKYIVPLLLRQKNLKYLIPWTEAGMRSLEKNLKIGKGLKSKIKPIHLCLNKIDSFEDIEKRKIKHENFSILFVSSVNYNGEDEFYSKGGRIAIGVFEKLKKEEKNVKLILRSKIPKEFSYLKNDPQVKIYEDILSFDKFQKIFLESDIFFFPGYQSPGMVFLDTMNYNLPIISTNVFANREMIKEGINGYLVSFPIFSEIHYLFNKYGVKNVPSGNMAKGDLLGEEMIEEFVKKIISLKMDKNLLIKMGKNSKELLLKEFSLEKRNNELKNVFDAIF